MDIDTLEGAWPRTPWASAPLPERSSRVLRELKRWPLGRDDVQTLELPPLAWSAEPWHQHLAVYAAVVTFWQMRQQVMAGGAPQGSTMHLALATPPLNDNGEPTGPDYAYLKAYQDPAVRGGWQRDVPLLFAPELVAQGMQVISAWRGQACEGLWEVRRSQSHDEAIATCLGEAYLALWREQELSQLPAATPSVARVRM